MVLLSLSEREIDQTIASDEQLRRDHLLLQEQLSEQNRDLLEAHIKSLHGMEELEGVQELRNDESSRRRLIEKSGINELKARIQELQNEVNCMNDSRDFKDAESVRSGPSHVPSQPAWISSVSEHTSPYVTSERQTPDTALDPRCPSGPRKDFQRIVGPTNKDCTFGVFILTNSLNQQHLFVGRYDSKLRYALVDSFLRKLCYGSKKWRWLNQWMISNLRVLSEELLVQTSSYLTRELLQH